MKITLPSITNGQDLTTLNSNFQAIATQLNTNVFYRTNIGSEPNTISQDVDFNGHAAYNLTDLSVNGVSLIATVTLAQTYAANSLASSNASATSASSSQTSAIASAASATAAAASATAAGTLKVVNNLSDVASVPTAKTNLGLDQVSNTSDANKPVSTATATALALKANSLNGAFSGTMAITSVGPTLNLNDSSGGTQTSLQWSNNAVPVWSWFKNTDNSMNLGRYVGGTFIDTPISVLSPSGAVKIKGQIATVPAGILGETITSVISTATSLGFASTGNLTGVTLTAGVWSITANATFTATTVTGVNLGLSSTTSSLPTAENQWVQGYGGDTNVTAIAPTIISASASGITFFLVGNVSGTGSLTFKCRIVATRIA